MAYEFGSSPTATLKMNVAVNSNGNIKTPEQTASGLKSFTIQGVKADANLAQAANVYDKILGIVGASFDSISATKTITVGVVETE